jgi:monoamine oxidase
LIDVLGQAYPHVPSAVTDSRFMDWPGDPWSMAGYSCAALGEVTKFGPIPNEGIGRLKFAGEHTCYKFAGYMEGALQSGVRVGREIVTAAVN